MPVVSVLIQEWLTSDSIMPQPTIVIGGRCPSIQPLSDCSTANIYLAWGDISLNSIAPGLLKLNILCDLTNDSERPLRMNYDPACSRLVRAARGWRWPCLSDVISMSKVLQNGLKTTTSVHFTYLAHRYSTERSAVYFLGLCVQLRVCFRR